MYFKAIEMQGFKSFAQKIKLDFKQGITAVVGPNGSGKSNISDALRWVMGEMSVKSLRGHKMEDVIFSGSDKRKPMGFAEVTIVIDNSDKTLGLDLEEVSITRRVYRSGESEYYINKASCRLRDIHELFMDTGLGREGYSIVGQGKIDEILSAKSDERRHIFDEASGIIKFRYRKDDAEKKLSSANENLVRVNDITSELENQLEPLQKQSDKAHEYLNMREIEKNLEVNIWLNFIDNNQEALDKVDEKYRIVSSSLEDVNKQILFTENYISQLKEKERGLEGDMDSSRAKLYENKNSIVKTESDIKLLLAVIENNNNNILRIEGENGSLSSRIKELDDFKCNRSNLISDYKTHELDASKSVDELLSKEAQLKSSIFENDNEYVVLNEEIIKLNLQLSENNDSINKTHENEAGLKGQLQGLNDLIQKSNDKKTEYEILKSDYREHLEVLSNVIQVKTVQLEKQTNGLNNLHNEKSILVKELDNLNHEIKTSENKKRILIELEEDFEGYSKSVKALMNEYKNGCLKSCKIYGPISKLINTSEQYITAIETVMGASMQNIVTKDEFDVKASIEFLKSSKMGRATFLPMSAVKGYEIDISDIKTKNGFIGIASSLVSFDTTFSGVVNYLLGRTIVVDNIDNAVNLAKEFNYKFRIVTLSGEVINSGGSFVGGSLNINNASLSRNNEIKKSTTYIEKSTIESNELSTKLDKISLTYTTEQDLLEKNKQELWNEKSKYQNKETEYNHILNNLKVLDNEIYTYIKDTEKIDFTIVSLNNIVNNAEGINAQLTKDISVLRDKLSRKSESIQTIRERLSALNEQLNEGKMGLSAIRKDIDVLQQYINDNNEELTNLKDKLLLQSNNIENYKIEVENAKCSIIEKQSVIVNLNKFEVELNTIISDLTLKRSNKDIEIDKSEAELKTLNENSFKLLTEQGRIEASKVKIETEGEIIISKLWEEYQLTYSTAQKYKSDISSPTSANRELGAIKNKIRQLGNINIDAISEYKEVKERYEFLSTQKNDLEKAKHSLLALIDELTQVMKTMFIDSFKLLNDNFDKTFKDLFGGGRASIRLVDPSDILGSGIEIDAEPPGKHLQNINLLSGGEKALTAISLLFSILKLKPTHFCIFDEIEATLDDINVCRFASYLERFSKSTQFIVITHKKGTMEVANTLYGVTMQEKGVSTLLSLEMPMMID